VRLAQGRHQPAAWIRAAKVDAPRRDGLNDALTEGQRILCPTRRKRIIRRLHLDESLPHRRTHRGVVHRTFILSRPQLEMRIRIRHPKPVALSGKLEIVPDIRRHLDFKIRCQLPCLLFLSCAELQTIAVEPRCPATSLAPDRSPRWLKRGSNIGWIGSLSYWISLHRSGRQKCLGLVRSH